MKTITDLSAHQIWFHNWSNQFFTNKNNKFTMFYKNLSKKSCKTKPELVCGFTIVEMLVSVGVVTLIMSSVLFNYSTFGDNLSLSSAGQELAITIRQSQTYGLTVKEVSLGGGRFDAAYGVYFNLVAPTKYWIFVDINADGKFDVGSGCGSGPTNTECIEKFNLRNNIKISNICNESSCPPQPSVRMMDVTFLRPNPDANIYFTNNGGNFVGNTPPQSGYVTGKIILISPKGKTLTITVESTGQVLVGPVI